MSPVRCSGLEKEVPLYLLSPLSVDSTNYQDLLSWEKNYEAIYRLWFRGEVNEDYFYSKLTSLSSALNQQGLLLRERISKDNDITCFYYLFSEQDDSTSCPNCKAKKENIEGVWVCSQCNIF